MRICSIHDRGTADYVTTWQAMQAFTDARDATTPDQIWRVQHPPVYTRGRNAQGAALRQGAAAGAIPTVASDRGGDITYHGPGQLVLYVLLDLSRARIGVKNLVHALEQSAIDWLAEHAVAARRRAGAPGVYVGDAKVAALGLRVRRGCSYHGLALNVDMDLAPFAAIDPCGYAGMAVTQCRDLGVAVDVATAGTGVIAHLLRILGYNPAAPDINPANPPATDAAYDQNPHSDRRPP